MGRRRKFARVILVDGPLAAGPGQLGWVTASVVPSGVSRFTLTGAAAGQPGMIAVHEYELLPRGPDSEQRARWVRLLRIEAIAAAPATFRGIPPSPGGG